MTAQQTSLHSLWHSLCVVFLITHHNKSREESWREPASYLPLFFLIAKTSQSSSLAKASLLGLKILSAPLMVNQRSNDSDSSALPVLPFQPSRQGPSPQSLYFSRHSSTFLDHTVILIQSTFHYTLNVQCSQTIASHLGNPAAKHRSHSQLLLKKNGP